MIARVINKIKRKLSKPPVRFAEVLPNIQVSSSTVLLDGTSFDFRLEKEPRIYVTIGNVGLIRATFTFETPKGLIKIGNNVHIGGAHFICRESIV